MKENIRIHHEDHIFPFSILRNFMNVHGKSQDCWYNDNPEKQTNPLIFSMLLRGTKKWPSFNSNQRCSGYLLQQGVSLNEDSCLLQVQPKRRVIKDSSRQRSLLLQSRRERRTAPAQNTKKWLFIWQERECWGQLETQGRLCPAAKTSWMRSWNIEMLLWIY